jgi:hypothetical protein
MTAVRGISGLPFSLRRKVAHRAFGITPSRDGLWGRMRVAPGVGGCGGPFVGQRRPACVASFPEAIDLNSAELIPIVNTLRDTLKCGQSVIVGEIGLGIARVNVDSLSRAFPFMGGRTHMPLSRFQQRPLPRLKRSHLPLDFFNRKFLNLSARGVTCFFSSTFGGTHGQAPSNFADCARSWGETYSDVILRLAAASRGS